MNADVFFCNEILDELIDNKNEAVMAVDKSRIKVGDYFFKLNDNNKIIKYGKELLLEDRSCEYVGMAKISKNFINQFKERLEQLVDNQRYSDWWENILYSFASENANLISTMDVEGCFWAEVDVLDDYKRILDYTKTNHDEIFTQNNNLNI